MRLEWDGRKARANIKKHGVHFEDAALVFDDPRQLTRLDRVEGGEERWQTIGLAGGAVLLLVAHTHTDTDGEEVIRIISARRAEKQERQEYERQDFQ